MNMQAKIVPWWRRALEFALGGIRTGFGLFSRHAQPEPAAPLTENSLIDKPEESLEVETVLTEQPNPKNLSTATEPVVAPTPAAEPIAKAAAAPIPAPELVTEFPVAEGLDAVDAVGPLEANDQVAGQPAEAAAETAPVAGNAPLSEPSLTAAIEPTPTQNIAPPPEAKPESDPQQEPDPEPIAEALTPAEPLPVAEITPAEEPRATNEPDPLFPFSSEAVSEEVELTSESIETVQEQIG